MVHAGKKKSKKRKKPSRKSARKRPPRRSHKKASVSPEVARQARGEKAGNLLAKRLRASGSPFSLEEFLERQEHLAEWARDARAKKKSDVKRVPVKKKGDANDEPDSAQRTREVKTGLDHDPQFILDTASLQEKFKGADKLNRTHVNLFLDKFRLCGPQNFHEARKFIESLSPSVHGVLKKYVKYSSRYGVYFFRKNGGFGWNHLAPPYQKFRANQVAGHLEPAIKVPAGESPLGYFEAPDLMVWKDAEKLIHAGKVNFIEVRDKSGYSVLNELERMGYFADGITVIHHRAERSYLYFLMGENVPQLALQEAGKILAAFRKHKYGRGAGRPANIETLKRAVALNAQGGRVKDMAVALKPGKEDKVATGQAYLSRMRKKRR